MLNKFKHTQNTQSGFTMIELLIVITVATTLALFSFKNQIFKQYNDLSKQKRVVVVKTISAINDAAGGYLVDKNEWPGFATSCNNALTTLAISSPTAYLRNITTTSPYHTSYVTTCDTNTFSISLETNDIEVVEILANQAQNATATGTILKSSIPRPVNQPTLTQFLLLDGSRAMTGDLDMGGNAITNTSHIATTNGLTVVGVETVEPRPTAIITKPLCPSGTSAKLNLAITGIVLTSKKIPFSNPPFIESQAATNWTIRLNVFDEDGSATADTGTFVQAIKMCE